MIFLKRKVYLQLKNHLKKQEISLILGPRQAGKTTLMLKLKEELFKKNIPTLYFNLDIFDDKIYFQTQQQLIEKIKREIGDKKAVIFIDEIQRLENAGLFLKGLYDLGSFYKFIVSGSGSLELKANIIESMTGRKKIIYCLPLSFEEFCANKLGIDFDQVSNYLKEEQFKKERLMEEYFKFGGYPKVVLQKTDNEKKEILKEIYQSYLEKDIKILLGVEKDYLFDQLVRILGASVGNLININELSLTLGSHVNTIKKYLYLLEKTFIITLLPPYFTNVRSEIKKMPKVYFFDLGFLNMVRAGLRGGGFFENSFFLRLKEKFSDGKLYFWRTKTGAEVDFVLLENLQQTPFQVKEKLQGNRLGKSLISFINRYQPKKAYLIGKNEKKESFYFGKTKVIKEGYI